MNEFSTYADIKEKYTGRNLLNKFITRDESVNKFLVFKSFTEFNKKRNEFIYLHEMVISENPRKFFVDLDAKDADLVLCEIHRTRIMSIIKKLFAKTYNKLIDDSNFVIIDSSGQTENYYKYSINMVIDKYFFVDYAEFKWFGEQVVEMYYSNIDAIPNFLDTNFFNRRYVGGNFLARLPNCTKTGEHRYKKITSNHPFTSGVIGYVTGCERLPTKSGIDREHYIEKYKKQKEVEITNPDVKHIVDRTSHLWDKTFQIRCCKILDNSIRVEFDRIKPSHCSFCNKIHHKENSLILTLSNGAIYESCRQSKESKCICEGDYIPVKAEKPKLTSKPTIPVNNDPNYLEYDKMFPEDKNVYFIKAEMKMGKTKKCIEYINNVNPEKIVMISFRRTFSAEMKTKYTGFELYSEIKESIDINDHNKIIIQVESLHRIEKPTPPVDLVILDEIESIWTQFSSGNLKDYYGVINTFTYLIRITKKIIIMDANLSKRTLRLIRHIRPQTDIEINYYVNRYNPSHDYKYYIASKQILYTAIYKYLRDKKKIAIMTNSLKESLEVAEFIGERIVGTKLMVYNSRIKQSKRTKHFADVNTYWKKYDCIICSPTVSAGVSFEEEYFDCVFGLFKSESCNVETCRQMLGRIRNVKEKLIYLSLSGIKQPQDEYPENPDCVRKHLKYHREKLIKNARNYGIELLNFEILENGHSDYYDTFAYQLVSENIAFDNKSKNNFCGRFIYQLKLIGTNIEFITQPETIGISATDVDKISTWISTTKENVKVKRSTIIADAENIDADTYQEIKNKINKCMDITVAEQNAMDKFKITNTIGIEPTVTLAEIFLNKKNITAFNMTKSLLTHSSKDHTMMDTTNRIYHLKNGQDLGDATAKYNSVANLMVRKLFAKLTNIKLLDLFTTGTLYLTLDLSIKNDIVKLRNAIRKLLNSLNKPVPIELDRFDMYEIFNKLMSIIGNTYWLNMDHPKCLTKPYVAFEYNGKLYYCGREVKETIHPIISIKGD